MSKWKEIGVVIIVILFFTIVYILCKPWLFSSEELALDEIKNQNWSGAYSHRIHTVLNEDTGVYYIISEWGGISPMYNSDGTLLIEERK